MALETRRWARDGRALDFTALGFGTAPLGNLFRAITDTEADATLAAAWAGGVRFFDTAPLYGYGLAETRLNRFLRDKPRDDYVLSTKVGRLLRACPPAARDGVGKWFDVPNRNEIYDYGYDGVMRSVEFSLERLGVDRIDVLFAHDADLANHGDQRVLDAKLAELLAGGWRAMLSLRDQGAVSAIGLGVNEWRPCQWLLERADADLFLLAGRYTLLEQEALESFLPLCVERGAGVVIGGPYNSGILATGGVAGATYNYEPAPPAIIERVRRIEAVCTRFATPLIAAAFHFPLAHPAVVSVIPGGQSAAQMAQNLSLADIRVPSGLWAALKAEGLLRPDAPTP